MIRARLGRAAVAVVVIVVVSSLTARSAHADVPAFADELREGFAERLRTHTIRHIDLEDPRARVAVAPRFVWIRDLALSLPGPPWMDSGPFLEAFDLAHTVWERTGQPDDIRALVLFVSFEVGPTAPFYAALANDVEGIGEQIFDDTPDSDLEGLIWMGELDELREAGPEYYLEAFVHEVAHRWGVYVDVDHPRLPPDALRGRQDRHWSFFADTDNSPMDGNDWVREGAELVTRFFSPHRPTFSPLDLYLMGHREPATVPPFEVVRSFSDNQPRWVNVAAETVPAHRLDVVVRLEDPITETVTMEQILTAEGPREPARGPDEWPIGVVLLSSGFAGTANVDERTRFEADLEEMIGTYADATGGAMELVVRTTAPGTADLGDTCSSDDGCNPARSDGCSPRGVCARACSTDAACGAGERCCDDWCAPQTACSPTPRDAGPADPGAADAGADPDAGRSDAPRGPPARGEGDSCRGVADESEGRAWIAALAGLALWAQRRRAITTRPPAR